MSFAIQEFTLCDGWVNTWSDEKGNPSLFDSQEEAFTELVAFLADMKAAYTRGDMVDYPSIEDYRIVLVH